MIAPSFQVTTKRDSVKFVCHSNSDVEWRFEGHKLPNNAQPRSNASTHWLHILYVGFHNEGIYECYGKLEKVFFLSTASLLVEGGFEYNRVITL